MNKIRFSKGLGGLFTVIASLSTGCGGGAGQGAAVTVAPTVISGVASKGLLKRSDVCVFKVTNGTQGEQIGKCTTTDDLGNYSIGLDGYTGPTILQVSGGTYVDEASGSVVSLSTPLRTALANPTGVTNVAITALTELAFQVAAGGSGGLTAVNIQTATTQIQNNFGVLDIVGILPINALGVPAGATTAQKTYSLALANISEYLSSRPAGSTLVGALKEMKTCLADPTTGCALGGSTVGEILMESGQRFAAKHSDFAGISTPVSNFGSITIAPSIKSVAVRILASAPANSCPNGGSTVVSGIDSNGNGVLDAAEGTNSQIICNGTNGLNGLSALVAVAEEPKGINCSVGGSKVVAGLDTNLNSLLDSLEISSTTFICSATNGLSTLVQIISEPAGVNCVNSGNKMKSGLDANANGILDSGEVTSTVFICNGTAAGGNLAVVSGRVSDGYVMGARVTLDLNDDRICDTNEPNTTTDSNGGFYFNSTLGQHMLCASGGVDVASLKPFVGQLTAPAGATQITPLTTLVMAKVSNSMTVPVSATASPTLPATVAAASVAVANALGLTGVDLLTTDPVAAAASSPLLIRTTAAVETLLEQAAASVAVASGTAGFSTGLYSSAVSSLATVLTAGSLPVLDLTSTSVVDAWVEATISQLVARAASTLQPVKVSALTTNLISSMSRAVGNIPAAQYATTGGAVGVTASIKQFSDSLLNIVEANRYSLLKPSSVFGCGTCLTTTQLQQLSAATASLASNAVPSASSLYLDLSSITVNGASMQTPTANSALNTVTVSGSLYSVTLQTSGTPATAIGSAGITITNEGGGQLQMVIDAVNVKTVNGKPFLSVPADAKLYVYRIVNGKGATATFSNVSSLLTTNANGLVSIDMAGLLALKVGNLPTIDTLQNKRYKVSVGLSGVPVAIKNAAGTALAVVENTSYTTLGAHLSLGADFFVSSVVVPTTTTTSNSLTLDVTTLAINDIKVSALRLDSYGSVALAGSPLAKVTMQVTGTPATALGTAGITVSSDTGWRLQLVIDKINVSTVAGKPVLSVPPTAKLYAYYMRGFTTSATFSNISSLLATDANGIVSLDMTTLLALLKTMDKLPATTPATTGMMSFSFGFNFIDIPVTVQTAASIERATSMSVYTPGYSFIGVGTGFNVNVQ